MKKLLIPLICIFLLLSGCSDRRHIDKAMLATSIDLNGCELIHSGDNHSVFGEGVTLMVFDCTENYDFVESQVIAKEWNEAPIDDSISDILTGIKYSGKDFKSNIGTELISVTDGFWKYTDNSDTQGKNLDSTNNFTLTVLDKQNCKFYYFDMDL